MDAESVLEVLGGAFGLLRREIESLSPEQLAWRPEQPVEWSVGEVANHATVAFFRQTYLIANSNGLAWGEPPVGEVTDDSGLPGVEGLPKPAYAKPADFYLRAIDLSLARLRDLVSGLESRPLSESILDHRRHGLLRGGEWVAYVGYHTFTHMVEIRQRKALPGFPG